jgi:hypothetical protein
MKIAAKTDSEYSQGPEFVAVARYSQYLARCADPVTEDRA